MTIPATTVRLTPGGQRMKNGYRVLWGFSADPDISLWEIDGQPPGLDAGDMVDTTTFHNEVVQTKAPRALIETTGGKFQAAYDPIVYNQCLSMIGVEQAITCKLPNGDTIDVFGILKSFKPTTHTNGNMPVADCEVELTNYDPVSGDEEVPNYKSAAGTDL